MIHIVFSSSAAGTLRQLFRARGIREKVVDLLEDLSFGPIQSPDLADREEWHDLHVPTTFGDWDWIVDVVARFRAQVLDDQDRLIWIAPTSSQEQAGFYWYLSQFGGTGLQMVIADYPLQEYRHRNPYLGLGELGIESMAELFDGCPRVNWDSTRFPEARWQSLVADNACLRVIDNGRLQSAANNFFDQFLLARCPYDWAAGIRVIGKTMGDLWKTGHHVNDIMLSWRLGILIKEGKLACDHRRPMFYGNVGDDRPKVRRVG